MTSRHTIAALPGLALALGVLALVLLPSAAGAAAPSSAARSAAAFDDVAGKPPATHNGARADVRPRRFRALRLDRGALAAVLAGAPRERTRAARDAPLTISLPAPDGRSRRFAVQRSSLMEPALADRHPEIATYSGSGIDDPGATVHLDLTPLGLHAAVRGPAGSWYVDPYYRHDESLYVSYRGADLVDNPHGPLSERSLPQPPSLRWPFAAPPAAVDGPAVSLRTYRLALASDPAYATYHGGAANVTAAKVVLINRVNQIYEQDLAIRLTLVAGNDVLNLDTAAEMTGANGPCGAAACYTSAQAAGCDVDTLDRTRVVLGQLIGASSYDVGHLGMGLNGGGIAYLGVVGDDLKGGGCTGVDDPVGDLFAVDYVAHELGHQFSANHTFNGVEGNCGDNLAGTAVEPGSGSTVMAYAGICERDDLQPHSDPYFSQRSIDEVTSYAGLSPATVGEVQTVSLRGFSAGDSFRLTYNGAQSATIARGAGYTAAAVAAAIDAILPPAATVSVRSWDGVTASVGDSGFSVSFGGSLGAVDVAPLTLTSPVGVTGFVGETTQGGATRNGGTATPTGNRAPVVEAPAAFTIPARTPFSLTGSATDADGDTVTYLWEQNDAGSGTGLVANVKPSGPLFRVFGTAAIVSASDALLSPSPGQNSAGTSPTRTFPDLAQIAAGNTNAATGSCPAAPGSPPVPAATVACYSEFLPTAAYANTLHFRLTARDGHAGGGGVAHDDTTLTLSKTTGPFRVTSQASAATIQAGAPVTVTWSVAGTNAAPVSAANVRMTLSTDGGLTFGKLVTPSTPNDGSQVVVLPNANTTHARIRVEAIGNVFFDVNHADFTILPGAPVVADDAPEAGATVQYSDAPATAVAVSASDENTQGSSLVATATGLPAGLSLATGTTSPGSGTPGSRTWSVAGATSAPPGTYPVEVSVADGAGHTGLTWFDVVVAAENAAATYAGDTSVTAGAGAGAASPALRFTVLDGDDGAPGDVGTATVTFKEGATTLCANVPVVAGTPATSGTATCTPSLAVGSHHIDATVGGRYTGAGSGDVQVLAGTPVTPPPPGPPPGPPPPPVVPTAALLGPNLASVASSPRISRTGRVALVLRCSRLGFGPAASTCAGTVRLTARIGGRRQTIGSASFSFARTARKTVSVKLTARARRAIRRTTSATLTMTVRNAGGASRRATRTVRILPARR